VVFLKFVEEVQTMAAAEVELNPPVSPFSKGDSLPWAPNSLWKRGEGEIFGRNIEAVMQRTSGSGY
jgi:hypothetical protein